jgi:hypothetical protein
MGSRVVLVYSFGAWGFAVFLLALALMDRGGGTSNNSQLTYMLPSLTFIAVAIIGSAIASALKGHEDRIRRLEERLGERPPDAP